jgi:hypothetical protein
VLLANGSTPVTVGESLTVSQLTGLLFKPTQDNTGHTSSFAYSVSDPAGKTAVGSATRQLRGPKPVSTHRRSKRWLTGLLLCQPISCFRSSRERQLSCAANPLALSDAEMGRCPSSVCATGGIPFASSTRSPFPSRPLTDGRWVNARSGTPLALCVIGSDALARQRLAGRCRSEHPLSRRCGSRHLRHHPYACGGRRGPQWSFRARPRDSRRAARE